MRPAQKVRRELNAKRTAWLASLSPAERAKVREIETIMSRVAKDLHAQLDQVIRHPDNGPRILADVMGGKGLMVQVQSVEISPQTQPTEGGEAKLSGLLDSAGKPLVASDVPSGPRLVSP